MYSNTAHDRFATASMILGMIAIFTSILQLFPLPFCAAALSLIFAILSKRSGMKMNGQAKAGVVSSVVTMILQTLAVVITIITLITSPSYYYKVYQQVFNQYYANMYDGTYDDFLKELKLDLFLKDE